MENANASSTYQKVGDSTLQRRTEKRQRHLCIPVLTMTGENMEESLAAMKLSAQLKIDITSTDMEKQDSVFLRKRTASVSPHGSVTNSNNQNRNFKLQRSLSSPSFDNSSCPHSPLPEITPLCITNKANHLLTRRSSTIHGKAFKESDFDFGATIGYGFFGKAVKATHRITGETLVIKELLHFDEMSQKSFLKEVAILGGLQHPNLIKFVGVLYKNKQLHVITEFAPGGTLENYLHMSSVNSLSWLEKIQIGIDIAAGMSYLHSQNVIHRDLNSPNCLRGENGRVLVSDFGLSRFVPEDKRVGHSQAPRSPGSLKMRKKRYTVVGSPYWMAPEMLKGGKYDEKVDIFSYGILLCEVIGQVPADPDYLPRCSDFSLDEQAFQQKFCENCPKIFYTTAFLCCNMNSDERPGFDEVYSTLCQLYRSMSKRKTFSRSTAIG